ncbi:MAG: flagellar basal body rod protein FlgB [Rubrobacteridae bacterium]|nr:flagellar basal body rod protein FlgB [Rubrobacteridae bacterium]
MNIGGLFSTDSMIALDKGLDAMALRQQVIANNVANINTPGFRKQDVSFEDELAAAIDSKQSSRAFRSKAGGSATGNPLNDIEIKVSTVKGTSMRYDGNSVDIDEEMSKLAETNIRYQAMSKLMSERFGGLKTVINGGR